ncbi:MAG: S1 family peptidase [Eubacterium sp.]|nr:S1 family peptidase [Eubacterium sp.]
MFLSRKPLGLILVLSLVLFGLCPVQASRAQQREIIISEDTSAKNLNLGRAIYTIDRVSQGRIYTKVSSIGCPAMYETKKGKKIYGFITCGHEKELGDWVYLDAACTKYIGKVTKLKINSQVDAAFVRVTNDSYKPSSKVLYQDASGQKGGVKIASQAKADAGTKVWKSGASTYLTKGKILDTNATTATNSGLYTGLYMTNLKAKAGDSGGLLYMKKKKGGYAALGICKSSNSQYSFYIPLKKITKALDIKVL